MKARRIVEPPGRAHAGLAASLLVLLASSPAFAQQQAAPALPPALQAAVDDLAKKINREADDESVFQFDFAVPSSPALTLLGVEKDKITQSNSLKPFVASVANLLQTEEAGQAIALELVPALLVVPERDQTYRRYMGDTGRQLLFRTRVSTALFEGAADSDASKQVASRATIGVSTSLLRYSDPLLAYLPGTRERAWTACLNAARPHFTSQAADALNIPNQQALLDAIANETDAAKRTELDRALKVLMDDAQAKAQASFAAGAGNYIPDCQKVADLAARRAPDLDIGAGAVWHGEPGRLSGFKDPSAVAWVSFRTALSFSKFEREELEDRSLATGDLRLPEIMNWYNDNKRWLTVGVAGRFGIDERIATGDKTKPEIRADTYSVWAGLEFNMPATRLSAQIGEEGRDPKDSADHAFKGSRTRYLGSIDQRLGAIPGLEKFDAVNGVWASLSYGKAEGTGALKGDEVVKLTFTMATPNPKDNLR